jgi:hypothetical protein
MPFSSWAVSFVLAWAMAVRDVNRFEELLFL